ncbi:LysR family transcriptional regulator [Pseudovibrio japonicus]|uniref:LysR family transcriptional regulator n=1 Tax=Pseudovibrio japonicus TaxID=366534 RepID=A0ABQ3E7H4_9HYPH|nr:LysR family transcriptional regulator [Pseudovibrio japonicus]GHB28400.1 LysR family transcriptional regulator [Pseudovibrio japonicus]
MDLLNLLESFVRVIDHGSLSGGARQRHISQPAMSQQLHLLEAQVGRELVFRTNKGVKPTAAGKIVYDHAQKMLRQSAQMFEEVQEQAAAESGSFVVSVSQPMGSDIITPLIFDLRRQYPDLSISIRMEDDLIDVVRDDIDLAIRTGVTGDTSGITRKVAISETCLVASADYVSKHGVPQVPEDLSDLKYIQYRNEKPVNSLQLFRDGKKHEVGVYSEFAAGHPQVMVQALLNSIGFTRMPLFMMRDYVKTGQLQRLLPDYECEEKPVYLVYPSREAMTRKAEIFIEAMLERFRGAHGIRLVGQKPGQLAQPV